MTASSCSKKEYAVSEIVGTLILITIAVSTFSAVSIIVLNPWAHFSDEPVPQVFLAGFIENNVVVVEHRGGLPIETKTKVTMTIEGMTDTFRVDDFTYWHDENSDGRWTVGECLIYPGGNLSGKYVSCMIVDIDKNSIIFDKTIQKGISVFSPTLTILPPEDVSETSATLKMYYHFYNLSNFASGLMNFTYHAVSGPYSMSPSVRPVSLDGWYGLQLNGLLSGVQYEYWAWMNWTNGTLIEGPMAFYTYQKTRGLWHFDEPVNSTIARDAMQPTCNGTVHEATFLADGVSNRSLNLTGITHYVEVPHHPKFNLSNDITIEAWINVSKIGAMFPGNVSELSSNNISGILGISCFEPHLIHLSGSIYAIAYHDKTTAYITTFQMTDNGVFLGTFETQAISVPHFFEPTIIHVDNDVYAVVFGAADYQTEPKNHIVTIPLYNNGTIGNIIDTFDFPDYYGREPNIIHLGADLYAVAFGGATLGTLPTGYLVTFSIDSGGDISGALIDSYKLPTYTCCSEPSIVYITGDIYAVTYNEYGTKNGYLITVHILTNGSIVKSPIDMTPFLHDDDFLEPTMIHVINDIYAISYGADSNYNQRTGFIKTLQIDALGHIVNVSLDDLPFYTYLSPIDYNFETDILHIQDELYAIAFTGGNASNWQRGFLTTISISNTGNISDSALFIYEFKGRSALDGTSALNLHNYVDRLIVVYGSINASERGFLTMEKIDLIGQEKPILQKGDAYGITINYNLLSAWMTIGNTVYSVSATVTFDNWVKIDFTYGGGDLTLYVNNIKQTGASEPCTGPVKTNTANLVFGGGFYGKIDEIKISRGLYTP